MQCPYCRYLFALEQHDEAVYEERTFGRRIPRWAWPRVTRCPGCGEELQVMFEEVETPARRP